MYFNNLPLELIQYILSFEGSMKYRTFSTIPSSFIRLNPPENSIVIHNGIFMKQIPRNDKRYKIFKTIKPPYYDKRENGNFHITITMCKKKILKHMYIFSNYELNYISKYKNNDIVYYYRNYDSFKDKEYIRK